MIHHLIPRVLSKLLIPFIVLFGLYVQFHGDFSPGGGFQAGVIVAAGIVLYGLIYGLDMAEKAIPLPLAAAGIATGLLLFGGIGFLTMFMGGVFLDYNMLDGHDPVHGQHLGIMLIEFGVGLTVASVMVIIFYKFAGRMRVQREFEQAGEEE